MAPAVLAARAEQRSPDPPADQRANEDNPEEQAEGHAQGDLQDERQRAGEGQDENQDQEQSHVHSSRLFLPVYVAGYKQVSDDPRRDQRKQYASWRGDVFAYFNNDQGGAAPRDAAALVDLLAKRRRQVATARG
jgi:hypothetical protein